MRRCSFCPLLCLVLSEFSESAVMSNINLEKNISHYFFNFRSNLFFFLIFPLSTFCTFCCSWFLDVLGFQRHCFISFLFFKKSLIIFLAYTISISQPVKGILIAVIQICKPDSGVILFHQSVYFSLSVNAL